MIYLDNAATSYPKPKRVIEDFMFCLKKCGGNPGRSSHRLSLESAEAVYNTRERIAEFLSIDRAERIAFTLNATHALNLAIKCLIPRESHVLTSDFEHNSVIRPLEAMKNEGKIDYSFFSSIGDIKENIYSSLRHNTSAIVCSLASNVIDRSMDIRLLSDIARARGLRLILDASQAVGHRRLDLSDLKFDALCAPAHKALFGFMGCGFICFGGDKRSRTFIEGGSGSNSLDKEMPLYLPEGYEAGTLPVPAIISLGSGIDFINNVGIEEIEKKLRYLTLAAYDRLSSVKEVKIYSSSNGIVSFNLSSYDSNRVAEIMDEGGICVRGGLHCAPSAHKVIGTLDRGAVRVSFSYLNDLSDVDGLYKFIKAII